MKDLESYTEGPGMLISCEKIVTELECLKKHIAAYDFLIYFSPKSTLNADNKTSPKLDPNLLEPLQKYILSNNLSPVRVSCTVIGSDC